MARARKVLTVNSHPRNTQPTKRARNTRRPHAQLEAFPASENGRIRQTTNYRAVVSIRLTGAEIDALDKVVEPRGRSRAIHEALMQWLAAHPPKKDAA